MVESSQILCYFWVRQSIRFIEAGSQQVVFSLQLILVVVSYHSVQFPLVSLMTCIITEAQVVVLFVHYVEN